MALDRNYFNGIRLDPVKRKYYDIYAVDNLLVDIRRQSELMNQRYEAQRSELEDANAGKEDLRRKGQILSEEILSLRETLQKTEQRALEAEKKTEEAEQRLKEQGQKLEASEMQLKDLQKKAAEAEEGLEALKQKAADEETKTAAAEQRIATAEQRVTAAEQKVETAEQRIAAAEEKTMAAEQRAITAEERTAAAEQKAATAEQKIAYAEQKQDSEEKRAEAAERRVRELETQLQSSAAYRPVSQPVETEEKILACAPEVMEDMYQSMKKIYTSGLQTLEDQWQNYLENSRTEVPSDLRSKISQIASALEEINGSL